MMNDSRMFVQRLQQHFSTLAEALFHQLGADEALTLNLIAENTLYLRFNNNLIRQNTHIEQATLELSLQKAGRTLRTSLSLSGQLEQDSAALQGVLAQARSEALTLPPDPNQVPCRNNGSSNEAFTGSLLPPEALIQAITGPARGSDLAGIYVGGMVIRGNKNSAGQDHWFATESFFLDYSLYNGPKAAKGCYASACWQDAEWHSNLQRTQTQLGLLSRPQQILQPGKYRSYFAPAAVAELFETINWGGFSASAWKHGQSPLKKLIGGERTFSPLITLTEDFSLGLSPRFNEQGEVSAAQIPLIVAGKAHTQLTNSRTAKEFDLQGNACNDDESARSLNLQGGTLEEDNILAAIGTGLYLSNLHYLNWSDRNTARITGMTRYACFWVEHGEIVGPIKDMRWDESLYLALGDKLQGLTRHTETLPTVSTYNQRNLGGMRMPGALIDEFSFTL